MSAHIMAVALPCGIPSSRWWALSDERWNDARVARTDGVRETRRSSTSGCGPAPPRAWGGTMVNQTIFVYLEKIKFEFANRLEIQNPSRNRES